MNWEGVPLFSMSVILPNCFVVPRSNIFLLEINGDNVILVLKISGKGFIYRSGEFWGFIKEKKVTPVTNVFKCLFYFNTFTFAIRISGIIY